MNEQLVVKNFGPIKDATVDFKHVTVFIGPTGGGKSTLAKLAAIFRDDNQYQLTKTQVFSNFSIGNFFSIASEISWQIGEHKLITDSEGSISYDDKLMSELSAKVNEYGEVINKFIKFKVDYDAIKDSIINDMMKSYDLENLLNYMKSTLATNAVDTVIKKILSYTKPYYVPSERIFVSAIEYSWAGLMRDDIGLPKTILEFSNAFSLSRKEIPELNIPFLDVKYLHIDGRDFIEIESREDPLVLSEAASGIQSVTPLLVLLEHLSRNTEQAQSFIIEEPELNLYPTAQQGLLNWLVEKCTKGENDLTLTTHSPYILSHLNLLLYAHQVAEKHPDRRAAVAAIVPEASWINPKEFACYQVENGGVQSLVDEELGLIDNNELDGLSGDAADAFDNLIRLSKGFATK